MTGYDITCNNAGGLYYQQCYDSQGHEIIAYTSTGQPIGFDSQSGKTYLSALDMSGNVYEPYGSAGIPYTLQDSGPISSIIGNWMPSGGADPQAFNRLRSMPGAAARRKEATTVVPWYYNVFGLKKQPKVWGGQWWPSWMSFSSESDTKKNSKTGAPKESINLIQSWLANITQIGGVEGSNTRFIRATAAVGLVGIALYVSKRNRRG